MHIIELTIIIKFNFPTGKRSKKSPLKLFDE